MFFVVPQMRLAKQITDFGADVEDEEQDDTVRTKEGLDDAAGVAVVFDEDDEDEADTGNCWRSGDETTSRQYCTRLGQAQTEEDKTAVLEDMRNTPDAQAVLEELDKASKKRDRERDINRDLRKEVRQLQLRGFRYWEMALNRGFYFDRWISELGDSLACDGCSELRARVENLAVKVFIGLCVPASCGATEIREEVVPGDLAGGGGDDHDDEDGDGEEDG
eukprot:Skav208901  [mRNA]  locus=scaffold270:524680:532092:- [translate_table: standard]